MTKVITRTKECVCVRARVLITFVTNSMSASRMAIV